MKKVISSGMLILFLLFLMGCGQKQSQVSDDNIINTTCYEYPNNTSGKNGIPITCKKDNDCDLSDKNVMARMKEFCSPAEVGIVDCGFRDFCGKDGFCKHDCSSMNN
ncbi:MAG: hypothetical protein WC678_05100 [Parcubacteria group bacterium]|jgi:hypothetical protein